jgi:molybdopterin converting factor small subunit
MTASASIRQTLRNHPTLRGLCAGGTLYFIGNAMQLMATAWLMIELTGSAILAALVQTAVFLPMFLLSLPAGVLADVTDRRRLLVVALLTQAALVALLTVLGQDDAPAAGGLWQPVLQALQVLCDRYDKRSWEALGAADRYGDAWSEETIEAPEGATVDTVWSIMKTAHPELAVIERSIAFAVAQEYVDKAHPLQDNDELAFIPPVSGGRSGFVILSIGALCAGLCHRFLH